jgi:hypothetical protein
MLKDRLFIQVIAALVSNNHDVVWFPVLTLIHGLTLSPGAKILNSLLQVASDTTHGLRNNCGMTIGFCVNGVTNPESAEIGEISCRTSSLVTYLLGQYFLPCLSVQGCFS